MKMKIFQMKINKNKTNKIQRVNKIKNYKF